ncbi:hypothetical protein CON62_20025, partial [Bacillus toyonensis]
NWGALHTSRLFYSSRPLLLDDKNLTLKLGECEGVKWKSGCTKKHDWCGLLISGGWTPTD